MAKTRATGSRGRAFDNPTSNISKTKSRFVQSDSLFPGLVKLMYGVLQCIHHIGILEENLVYSSLPKGLEKKVKELNSFIKPARSNLDITFDLSLTNQNWATQTTNVLIKHYANCWKIWSLTSFRPCHLKTSSIVLKLQQLSGEEKITKQN